MGIDELEGVTAVLLLTGEDDFNALASTMLRSIPDGPVVYRVGAPLHSHGVVEPYADDQVLFGDRLTRILSASDIARAPRSSPDPLPARSPTTTICSFVIRADGRLVPVTEHERPAPEEDDTLVLLGPARRPAPLS